METIYKRRFASYNSSVENTDWDDIQAALAGDDDAFERLVLRYQSQIAGLTFRFSRDKTTCERLVQDTFVEAYFSLKSYKAKAPFIHWLKKIATRVGYRFWKEQDRAKLFLPLEEFDFAAPANRQELEPGKAAEILQVLFSKLDRTDRLVLTLMHLEDCPIKEIAQRMAWTIAGTKMRAMRARKKLKKIAEKEKILEKLEWMQ